MYSFVQLFILSLLFCNSATYDSTVSLFSLSVAPPSLFSPLLSFSATLFQLFLLHLHTKLDYFSAGFCSDLVKHPAKHPLTSAQGQELSVLVCVCGGICTFAWSRVCASDFVCVCVMWCRVESSKPPPIGPETAAPTHLGLFTLHVPLKFLLQT